LVALLVFGFLLWVGAGGLQGDRTKTLRSRARSRGEGRHTDTETHTHTTAGKKEEARGCKASKPPIQDLRGVDGF
jgi:hypothetical protein